MLARDALATIRLSLGRWSTTDEVARAAKHIGDAVEGLQN